MESTLVLIPSPLFGPATWTPTAQRLELRGRPTRVPNLHCVATAAPPYWPAGVEAIVRAAGDDPVVLVPHSNAGLYIPAVFGALGDQARGAVFVDAAVPWEGPIARRSFFDALADADGRLPPWTSWWADPDVAGLFPDAQVRARVEAEQSRMPVAYYDHRPPAPDGWDDRPCAYLWFGEPYDASADQAAARGWPTQHVAGNHLHMLFDPDRVAAAVVEMAGT